WRGGEWLSWEMVMMVRWLRSLGATVGVVTGLARDRGGMWRYCDDGGDDLDGVVAVCWLRWWG
nr:hypothetical protein [Tanacetum cinerariifolium]